MNRTTLSWGRTGLSLLAVATLAACAVTPFEVAKEATVREEEVKLAVDLAKTPERAVPVSGLRRMDGNFLGSSPIPISHSYALPPHVRNLTMSFGAARGSLSDVARNIRTATGISVRMNPDVNEGVEDFAGQVTLDPSADGDAPQPIPVPVPVPIPGAQVAGDASMTGNRGKLPLSHQGDLADYLNNIASILDINWEYAKGEIVFFRAMTRRFQLAVSPGVLAYRDDVSSGGSGSSGSDTAGTFASASSASVEAQLSPWAGVEDAVRSMISPNGKVHVNQASGGIVVTDTKSKLDQIGKYIEEENALLNRQVRIEMREVLVERTGEASVGLDVSLVYKRFLEAGLDVNAGLNTAGDLINATNPNPNYSIGTTAPATLASAQSGTMTVNFERQGYFQGSTLAMKALNGVGKVVGDSTRTIVTTNRTPGRLQDVIDRAYLAETKPASGGSSDGSGGGVPGLVPGLVTYGENITVVPTIRDNNEILLQLFSTRSSLLELNSQSAGSGTTFQQINTPVLQRKKNSQNIRMRDKETLVIVSNAADTWNSKDRVAITGGSVTSNRSNVISVLLVTARVMGM